MLRHLFRYVFSFSEGGSFSICQEIFLILWRSLFRASFESKNSVWRCRSCHKRRLRPRRIFFLLFLIIIKHFINRNNLLCFSDFPFKIFTNAKRLERARAVKLNGSLFFQKKIKRGKAETKQKAICVVMRIRMRMRIFSPTPTENPASTLIVLRNVLFSALSWLFIFLVIPKNYFIMFFFPSLLVALLLVRSDFCGWTMYIEGCIYLYQGYLL